MRALFLTPQVPYPPAKGTTLRNFNLIKNLADRHEIHLLTFAEAGSWVEPDSPLLSMCKSIHTVAAPPGRAILARLSSTLLSSLPDMALRLPSIEFRERLVGLLSSQRFDIVQVEGIEMAQYMDAVLASPAPRPAIIFDEHNAEYLLQRRAFETDVRSPTRWVGAAYSLVQWRKLQIYERAMCRKAQAVVAVSEADKKALLALAPNLDVAVVSNGIDVEYFGGQESGVGGRETRDNGRGPGIGGQEAGEGGRELGTGPQPPTADPRRGLVFVGTMDYRPNVDAMAWFCRDVLPLIVKGVPEVRLQIVGRNPARAVREAAGRNVDIVGAVDDVRPYIYQSAIYVVPMRIGGGVRFKVLEAMACGVPVVSTAVGAEGIDVADDEHLLLAEEPAAFAAKVIRLLKDPEAGKTMAQRARERVLALYDWRVIVPKLEEVWRKNVDS